MTVEEAQSIIESERAARIKAERALEESLKMNEGYRQQLEHLSSAGEIHQLLSVDRLLNAINDAIYVIDSEGQFSFVNRAGEKMLGVSQSEILGKHFRAFIRSDFREDIEQYYYQQIEEKRQFSYVEFPIERLGKKQVWIGQNASFQFEGDDLQGVCVVARDITKFWEDRQRLTRSENKYRTMIDNMDLGLLEVDLDDRIIHANNSFCRFSGYNQEEILGRKAMELFLVEGDEDIMTEKIEKRKGGVGDLYELRFRRKDNEIRYLLISGSPTFNSLGEIIGSIGIHLDITERRNTELQLDKALELAERAKEAEKKFLARMSHEMRTPLNAVLGMSHLLLEKDGEEEEAFYIQSIHYSAKLLMGLVTDVLDYNRIESGDVSLNLTTTDLRLLFKSLEQIYSFNLRKNDLVFELIIDESIPPLVEVDQALLNQVLLNLLENAVKFTDVGSVRLMARVEQCEDDADVLRVEIEDTGEGIPSNELAKIFESFNRSENYGQLDRRGSGLGLAIVKQLTQIMCGEITAESEVNKGSKFTLRIPITRSTEKKANRGFGQNASRVRSALIAEDNDLNSIYLIRILERAGIKCKAVKDGEQAVGAARQELFDIIFMDVQMPKLDGLQATKVIRADRLNPNQYTRIIGLSAFAFEDDIKASVNAGMTQYITKPFVPSDIYELLGIEGLPAEEAGVEAISSQKDHFELKVLEDLYMGDREYAYRMFSLYLQSIPDELILLEKYAKNQDSEECRRILHKIGPSFKMVGLDELSDESSALRSKLGLSEMIDGSTSELIDFIVKVRSTFIDISDALARLNRF